MEKTDKIAAALMCFFTVLIVEFLMNKKIPLLSVFLFQLFVASLRARNKTYRIVHSF